MAIFKGLSISDTAFVVICFCTSILCVLFSAVRVFPGDDEERHEGFTVEISMNELSFKYMLVIEMCVSVLVVLEVVVDHFSKTFSWFSYTEFGIISILFSLLLSSGITFFLCIPTNGYTILYGIWIARLEIMTIATLFVASKYDNVIWKSRVVMMTVSLSSIASLILVFRTDWSGLTGILLLLLSYSLILCLNIKWYHHIWIISKVRKLTNDEINCTVLCVIYICIAIMSWTSYGVAGFPRDRDWNLTLLLEWECYFTAYVLFITVQQRRNIGMEVAKYQLELEFKRMFVRYISHEVRTPLNTAIIGLQVLQEQMHGSQEQGNIVNREEYLDTLADIHTSCDIAVNVLNELLTFDKLEAGTLMIEKTEISFANFVYNTVQPFQVQARQKEIIMSIQNVCENPTQLMRTVIFADKNKIAQIIRNMVSNALKFTQVGGSVNINMDVKQNACHSSGRDDVLVILDVVDTGTGISESNQARLFKEIVQFNPAKLQGGGGSGLGLYISHGIATLHDGSLTVYSEGVGHGSTFTLTLPTHQSQAGSRRETLNPRSPAEVQSLPTTSRGRHVPPASRTHTAIRLPSLRSPRSPAVNNSVIYLSTASTARHGIRHRIGKMSDYDSSSVEEEEEEEERVDHREEQNTISVNHIYTGDEKLAEETNPVIPSTASKSLVEGMRSLRVLLVDDSDLSRKMLCRLLKTRFHSCREAENGKTALEMAMDEDGPADIILMDANMPVMSGLEAAKRLRASHFEGIIIGVTGNVTQEDVDEFLVSGADGVLSKPLAIRELEMAISKLIRVRRETSSRVASNQR